MKERPIIMGAESVRAILEGRKTQSRRVINPQPVWPKEVVETHRSGLLLFPIGFLGQQCGHALPLNGKKEPCSGVRNPYGNIGDRLWVREAFKIAENVTENGNPVPIYKAGCSQITSIRIKNWKSPLFMPRRLSRITLEITDIRVERVQDITEEGAIAEGIESFNAVASYSYLWNSLNAKRGYPWESNPWVWVVTFKVVA